MKAMKIFSMMLMAALTLGFAACSDDDDIEVKDFKSGIKGSWMAVVPEYVDGSAAAIYTFLPDAKTASDGNDGTVEVYVSPSDPGMRDTTYVWRYSVEGYELNMSDIGMDENGLAWANKTVSTILKMTDDRMQCKTSYLTGSWRGILNLVRVPSNTFGDWANDFDWDWAHEWDASKED